MKRVMLAVALAALGAGGCAKVVPAAVKAIGGGAKVAPNAAVHAAPAAAAPAVRGVGAAGRVGQEGLQAGADLGAGQLTGDNKRRR